MTKLDMNPIIRIIVYAVDRFVTGSLWRKRRRRSMASKKEQRDERVEELKKSVEDLKEPVKAFT